MAGPWLRTWLLAVAGVVVVLGLREWHLRGTGVRPSLEDEAAAWSLARARVRPDSVVALGASRIQSALVPEVFAAGFGGPPPVQLALVDTSPLPVLEDLAADVTFHGTVLCEVIETMLFDATGAEEAHAVDLLRQHDQRQRSPARFTEARLGQWVQLRLVGRRAAFSLRQLLQGWFGGRRLEPPFVWERADRYRSLDFRRIDAGARRSKLIQVTRERGRPAGAGALDARIARVSAAVTTIARRGGRVVLLRLPSSGGLREVEEQRYPRDRYWDRLVKETGAAAVHFEDHASLQGFECPDGTHLDFRDAPRFSAALADVVRGAVDP